MADEINDVIRPYDGPQLRSRPGSYDPEQKAADMAHDAVLASQALPELTRGVTKGIASLDGETANNRREALSQMRVAPPKPATIINLHPWELMFPVGAMLMRGIQVPACHPGQQFAMQHIRRARLDSYYAEDGMSRKFRIIEPITLAAEFVREFSNPDNDGGGVLIYTGESNPERLLKDDLEVECYDQNGHLLTTPGPGFEYDEYDNKVPTIVPVPVKRRFSELLDEAIKRRNAIYFKKVQDIDRDMQSPDSRRKVTITERHRLMAEVLFAEGLITKVPDWNLASRLQEGLMNENCPSCSSPRKQGSYKCSNCGNILDALAAYKDHAIEFEHAKMESLTTEELAEAAQIKVARDKAKAERKKILAAVKADGAQE